MKVDKHDHFEVGKQIRIVLARCERVHTHNSRNLIPGSIHTITDRPSRKDLRNGVRGVWVDGTVGKVYALFYEWQPYFPPMTRTVMVRTTFKRTK